MNNFAAAIKSIALTLSILLAGCEHTQQIATPEQGYLVGAFNLRNFGPTRLQNPDAMQSLVTIARRYDLLVLMEIRDRSGASYSELLAQINAQSGFQYALELSQRSGRGNRKEQYGFLYRLDRVNILDLYDYDDGIEPDLDLFEREPAVAYVDFAGVTTSIIALHADPDSVLFELNRLVPVYEDAVIRSGDEDAIIIGDLNADCSFLPDNAKPFVNLVSDDRFLWLIGDEVDTTVRASTDCAYDRIVMTKSLQQFSGVEAAAVFNFAEELTLDEAAALDVSDHFPVEMLLTIP